MKKNIAKPLHQQTEEAIIALMKNATNNKLQSEEELAEVLGVSRTTVREAMNSLLRKGALTKRKGKGNFFLKSVMETQMRIDTYHDFSIVLLEAGFDPTMIGTVLDTPPPSREVCTKLGCAPDERVTHLRWTYLADEANAIIIESWIPTRLFLNPLPSEYIFRGKAISEANMYQTYCQQDLSHHVSSLRTGKNPEICRLFGYCEDTTLIISEQFTYNIYDECISYAHLYFNTDIMDLRIVAKIP